MRPEGPPEGGDDGLISIGRRGVELGLEGGGEGGDRLLDV